RQRLRIVCGAISSFPDSSARSCPIRAISSRRPHRSPSTPWPARWRAARTSSGISTPSGPTWTRVSTSCTSNRSVLTRSNSSSSGPSSWPASSEFHTEPVPNAGERFSICRREVFSRMELIAPPGVYRPQNDTWMLAEAVATAGVRDADVLDVRTGTGALAIAALQSGARSATGLDVSAKAIAAAWLNARRHRVPLRVRRGDIRNLRNQQYNVVLSNPPYVPSMLAQASGAARAWDAGVDGREILDPLCSSVNRLLRPQGFLLLVQSVLSHPEVSVRMLREAGLDADIVERRTLPFGPVLRGRAKWLERRDLIEPGQRSEELVVIRAQR